MAGGKGMRSEKEIMHKVHAIFEELHGSEEYSPYVRSKMLRWAEALKWALNDKPNNIQGEK
jgi:hypothetical protein